MKQLKYFIGGILTILLFLPISNKFLELVELWIETLKIKPSLRLLNFQKDTTLLREFLEQPPEENIVYEYEFYDEEDD